ncbi:hypothetical protein BH09PSE2_BH09PSE2_05440 [soil metagenome]
MSPVTMVMAASPPVAVRGLMGMAVGVIMIVGVG